MTNDANPLSVAGIPDRFTILRQVGEGGMGVVYEAIDRHRGARLALKTLPKMDPVALYRFKREFRSLAGLSHPNLISLHELISDGSVWFFTMEFVDGVDFITAVRRPLPGDISSPESVTVTGSQGVDLEALRDRLRQLTEGVHALHAANMVHRDLKPSNVLVRADGHLVILDLGLAKEMNAPEPIRDLPSAGSSVPSERTLASLTRDNDIVGSVPYMAPEQVVSGDVTGASDWYSVGVMLYEALTGVRPFVGEWRSVLLQKQMDDPIAPRLRSADVPEDLDALCMALLQRDPMKRPTGDELLARLTRASRERQSSVTHPAAFVGRRAHLATLDAAYQELTHHNAVIVHIRGRSGAGKTALAERFRGSLPEETIVLIGRCFEQESVPYKALDSVIDDLCQRLMDLPDAAIDQLIPNDIAALARIFPVLGRVDAIRQACYGRAEIPDVLELRRRAFDALGEMLHRLGEMGPLVLFIDDLQWGDVDSAALLISFLEAPTPPRLMLIACYRTEHADRNPCLIALNAARRLLASFEVEVDPLPFEECLELANILLKGQSTPAAASRIARESGGSPYFVYELARQVERGADSAGSDVQPDLDDALWRRVLALPASARHLLEVIAVAGKPFPVRSAYDATALGLQAPSALATLRAEHLVRGTGPSLDDEIETYHDRIRESVSHHLTPVAEVEHHRRLAMAFEAAGNTDLEATASHFHRGGLLKQAVRYYSLAGDKAATALAFGRSAELFGLALTLGIESPEAARLARRKRADALANAGRGFDAGHEYQQAAVGADPHQVLELERLAGYQYCVSGHIDEGRKAFELVLKHYGTKVPRTRRQALASLLLRRAQLRLRGMDFVERREADVPREQIEQVDIFWSVGTGLTIIDPIRGATFQTQDLLLALRAGEPYRVARALAWEAAHISMLGVRMKKRANAQLAAADALAERIGVPHATGMVLMSRGVAAYFQGELNECRSWCEQAATIFRNQCTGVSWELETCNAFAFWPSYFRGEYDDLARRFTTLIAGVRERGARLAEADLTTFGGPFVWLAADDPDGARNATAGVMGEWSRQDFQVQHFMTLTAESQIDLYRGDAVAAWQRVSDQWTGLRDAMLLHVEIVRIYMLHLRARCALAAVGSSLASRPLLASAARDARRLRRERPAYARALAGTIEAALAFERGDTASASDLLRESASRLDALGWGCFGVAARRRLGELEGGDAGNKTVNDVDDYLRAQGVRRPDRMTALQLPGFSRR